MFLLHPTASGQWMLGAGTASLETSTLKQRIGGDRFGPMLRRDNFGNLPSR
ncbi:hypothetical protein IVA98_22620 [Bradyrhizobium sp. 160]|uniref:hypothetical protein n=1 Tax=Bradyrhizobium sp. 160 TaxID=2782634 RepID=UPI001FFAFDD2|nr:hypothetical protein [Bradyrhizobium sp. 160]MCK1625909.1 hypothetical protein [Bradyrhizobium sp. 160]